MGGVSCCHLSTVVATELPTPCQPRASSPAGILETRMLHTPGPVIGSHQRLHFPSPDLEAPGSPVVPHLLLSHSPGTTLDALPFRLSPQEALGCFGPSVQRPCHHFNADIEGGGRGGRLLGLQPLGFTQKVRHNLLSSGMPSIFGGPLIPRPEGWAQGDREQGWHC